MFEVSTIKMVFYFVLQPTTIEIYTSVVKLLFGKLFKKSLKTSLGIELPSKTAAYALSKRVRYFTHYATRSAVIGRCASARDASASVVERHVLTPGEYECINFDRSVAVIASRFPFSFDLHSNT